MIIERKEFEVYDSVKSKLNKRTAEIFKLLKGITLSWNEGYEYCTVEGDLEFRVGGHYRNEYDYTTYSRPLDYLFMTDEDIIKAEEEREVEIKRAEELEEKEKRDALRKKEIEQLNELRKKYPNI